MTCNIEQGHTIPTVLFIRAGIKEVLLKKERKNEKNKKSQKGNERREEKCLG